MSYTKILSELDDALTSRSATGLAKAFGTLVREGAIAPGDKLPPIRTVAAHLGVSTTTVSEAWAIMAAHAMIETDRRRGTRVRSTPAAGRARYWRVPVEPGTLPIDLSTGTPDPALLPDIGPILARVGLDLGVTSYVDDPLLPALDRELRRLWPYDPPAITVVDGALDGFERVMRTSVRLGDVVVVEDPTYPPLLDTLEQMGARIVGVPIGTAGLDLDSLAEVMTLDPRIIVLQTGAHNPTGARFDDRDAARVAQLIQNTSTIVVEDVQGWMEDRAFATVGRYLPEQTLRIQSFSKTHGPDLRIAALTGPTVVVAEVVERRQLGPGWTSRLIQRLLAEMLADQNIEDEVTSAVSMYDERRRSLVTALRDRGVQVEHAHGLNVWIPVRDEQRTTVSLAAGGIGVAPGSPFQVERNGDFVRVTISGLVDEAIDSIADALAAAADR